MSIKIYYNHLSCDITVFIDQSVTLHEYISAFNNSITFHSLTELYRYNASPIQGKISVFKMYLFTCLFVWMFSLWCLKNYKKNAKSSPVQTVQKSKKDATMTVQSLGFLFLCGCHGRWRVALFVCLLACLFVCFAGGGVNRCKIGATFFFSFNRRRSTQIFDDHSKNIGTHNFSTHKSVFTALAHTENRHTNYKHSNQSQILSYIRQQNFLSATSMLSLWCTGCHCHTHWKILSNTHNNATGLSGGWWAIMGHTHSGWYTMVHNTNWLCWLSAPVLSLGL